MVNTHASKKKSKAFYWSFVLSAASPVTAELLQRQRGNGQTITRSIVWCWLQFWSNCCRYVKKLRVENFQQVRTIHAPSKTRTYTYSHHISVGEMRNTHRNYIYRSLLGNLLSNRGCQCTRICMMLDCIFCLKFSYIKNIIFAKFFFNSVSGDYLRRVVD